MKKYIWFVVLCGLAVALANLSAAQQRAASRAAANVDSVTSMDLKSCADRVPVIPQSRVRTFPQERIESTLNGIWRGRVSGEYDKQVIAQDGYVNVDY